MFSVYNDNDNSLYIYIYRPIIIYIIIYINYCDCHYKRIIVLQVCPILPILVVFTLNIEMNSCKNY